MRRAVMILSRQQLEYIADNVAPMLSWPTHINELADKLETTNPKFNRDKFIKRAVKAWEDQAQLQEIDDEINF